MGSWSLNTDRILPRSALALMWTEVLCHLTDTVLDGEHPQSAVTPPLGTAPNRFRWSHCRR
jgi:hypothetical protein